MPFSPNPTPSPTSNDFSTFVLLHFKFPSVTYNFLEIFRDPEAGLKKKVSNTTKTWTDTKTVLLLKSLLCCADEFVSSTVLLFWIAFRYEIFRSELNGFNNIGSNLSSTIIIIKLKFQPIKILNKIGREFIWFIWSPSLSHYRIIKNKGVS